MKESKYDKVKQELKGGVKSKTVWFSTVGVPTIMAALSYAQENLPLIEENLGASYAVTAFLIGAAGVILRKLTNGSLADK